MKNPVPAVLLLAPLVLACNTPPKDPPADVLVPSAPEMPGPSAASVSPASASASASAVATPSATPTATPSAPTAAASGSAKPIASGKPAAACTKDADCRTFSSYC